MKLTKKKNRMDSVEAYVCACAMAACACSTCSCQITYAEYASSLAKYNTKASRSSREAANGKEI